MNLIQSINFAAITEAERSMPDSANGLLDSACGESILIRGVPRALAGIWRICVPCKLLSQRLH